MIRRILRFAGTALAATQGKNCQMTSLTSRVVEPFLRLVYGPPLPGRTALPATAGQVENRTPGGLVLVADGVGGFDVCGTAMRYVLAAEKLPYAVEVFPWGHGFGRWHADLTNTGNRDEKAGLLAESVRQYKAERPMDPVFLVAKSGGAGIVVKALERVDEKQVELAVLLAPALSPAYDLSLALRAVRHKMVVFWSPLDVFMLGMGTKVFGTVDRVRSVGAGLVGFRTPATGGKLNENNGGAYDKLRQIHWRPRMAATLYLGGHFGTDSPLFLRKYVAPLLRLQEASRG
jgi:hypothetical protein